MNQTNIPEYDSSDNEDVGYNMHETNIIYLAELYKYLIKLKLISLSKNNKKMYSNLMQLSKFEKRYKYNTSMKDNVHVIKYIPFDNLRDMPNIKITQLKNGAGCVISSKGEYLKDEHILIKSPYLLNNTRLTKAITTKVKSLRSLMNTEKIFIKDTFTYSSAEYIELNNFLEAIYNLRILLNNLAYTYSSKKEKLILNNPIAKDKLWEVEKVAFPTNTDKKFMVSYKLMEHLQNTQVPPEYSVLVTMPPEYKDITSIYSIDINQVSNQDGYVFYRAMPIILVKHSTREHMETAILLYKRAIHELAYNSSDTKTRSIRLPKRNSVLKFTVLD